MGGGHTAWHETETGATTDSQQILLYRRLCTSPGPSSITEVGIGVWARIPRALVAFEGRQHVTRRQTSGRL